MTYLSVLMVFIIPPTLVLGGLAFLDLQRAGRRDPRRPYLVILIHVLMAVLYTTPWDNYLVATQVWWYRPERILGLTVGWVPIEEYAFFVLQTLMTGLLTVQVVRAGIRAPVGVEPRPKLRWAVLASTVALWALSLLALLSGWAPGRYLGLILVWGLLPFLLQWSFGGDLLLADWRRLGVAILAPTLYLWLVDAIAIGSGAWIIDPAQTTGVKLGVLPLEEMVFFLVTNLLIVSGITLALSPQSSARWQAYRQRLAGWWGVRVGDDAFSAGD